MSILYEIQLGMSVEHGMILKLPGGWLIGRDNLVKRDKYACWSCNCSAFENIGVCSHTVAVAAIEDPRIRAMGEEFMRRWTALGSEAARLRAALEGRPS